MQWLVSKGYYVGMPSPTPPGSRAGPDEPRGRWLELPGAGELGAGADDRRADAGVGGAAEGWEAGRLLPLPVVSAKLPPP